MRRAGLVPVQLAAAPWDFPLVGRTRMLAESWQAQGVEQRFVEFPSPRAALRGVLRRFLPASERERPPTWVERCRPLVPVPWSILPAAALAAQARVGSRRLAGRLGRSIAWERAVALVVTPFWAPWLDRLPFHHVVYDCIDEPSVHVPHSSLADRWAAWEEQLLARASGAIVTAQSLGARLRARRPGLPLATIRNGVNDEWFRRRAREDGRPPELGSGARPIVGFVGALYRWIDWELVDAVTSALGDLDFAFVGPDDGNPAIERIARRPNVRFLGPRAYARVPSYIDAFDVGWVPFRTDAVGRAANPVKIYEYLALGKPVVSTPVADLEHFEGLVRSGATADEIIGAIRAALEAPVAERDARRDFACRNSWAVRSHEVLEFLDSLDPLQPRVASSRAHFVPRGARLRCTAVNPTAPPTLPRTLEALRSSGWRTRSVKEELRANFIRALACGEDLFPGIIGYGDTVIPEIANGIIAGHDMLFLGEKGQAKSRLMRLLVRYLDEWLPYLDLPNVPVHEDPERPITRPGRESLATSSPRDVKIAWWHRDDRYAERLAPGTKFADLIGEIDPARLAGGTSMSAEEALHFGLIPRLHRGIFAMNELPDLDELVQVGLFNILEERDVQIRGYPVRFDIDVLILFSANPATYNRSGKVIPQLKDRIGSTIQTHYPRDRSAGIEIIRQEASLSLDGEWPVLVPPFMEEIVEQISICARTSNYVDHSSGVSARFSTANYRTMVASARQRAIRLGERPAVVRITDLGHLHASSIGKLELDMMGSHQMSERQVLEAIVAEAVATVFEEYVDEHGLDEIAQIFAKGVKVEVGDMLPSSAYAARLERVPPAWAKAFEVNAAGDPAVRASCIEFVLAGLHATERVSRAERHGRIEYEV